MRQPTRSLTICSLALAAVAVVAASGMSHAQVDFSRYVAIGDSLTAGHTNISMVQTTQETSVPALLHARSGAPGPFRQPLFAPPGFSLEVVSGVPTGGLALSFNQAGLPCNPFQLGLSSPIPGSLLVPPPYDNLGVPGAKVSDVASTTGGGYFGVVLAGLGSQLDQALAADPTFVTVWIGANDVLNAARSGLVIEGLTMTPVASFAADFDALIDALDASGAQLAIANVPNVTSIPFVNTISRFLPDPATCGPLLIGGQPVPLLGPDGPLQPGDRVLLPAASKIAAGIGVPPPFGPGIPLGNSDVLSAAEVATISARIDALNAIIRDKAVEVGAAHVDVAGLFDRIEAGGLIVGGIDYSTSFLTGGLFSYDAFHGSAMGYAVVANEFIESINAHFGSSMPLVDLFPFVFGGQSQGPVGPVLDPASAITAAAAGALQNLPGLGPVSEVEREQSAAALQLQRRSRETASGEGALRVSPRRARDGGTGTRPVRPRRDGR